MQTVSADDEKEGGIVMKTYSPGRFNAAHAVIACILAMVIALIAGIGDVNAANVCSEIYGDCNYEETFNVTTGAGCCNNQSVKLTQTKGVHKYELMMLNGSKYKTKKQYGIYYITVTDENGNEILSNEKWSGKTFKIKLSKNTSYDITVTPETNYGYGVYADDGWQTDSTWKVSRTKNCTFCSYD